MIDIRCEQGIGGRGNSRGPPNRRWEKRKSSPIAAFLRTNKTKAGKNEKDGVAGRAVLIAISYEVVGNRGDCFGSVMTMTPLSRRRDYFGWVGRR